MTKGVRTFDFPPVTPLGVALRVIIADLATEGLTTDNATSPRITSVLIGGVKRVILPNCRITAKVDRPAGEMLDTGGLSVDDFAVAFAKAAAAARA